MNNIRIATTLLAASIALIGCGEEKPARFELSRRGLGVQGDEAPAHFRVEPLILLEPALVPAFPGEPEPEDLGGTTIDVHHARHPTGGPGAVAGRPTAALRSTDDPCGALKIVE